MKTIQQVIKELDSKEIENSFFYDHPINLWEVKDLDEITIGLFRKRVSSKFQAFLERLRNMEIENNLEDQWILLVYKSLDNDNLLGHYTGLIRMYDLVNKDDLSKVETYAYQFTEQKEALGFLVADTKLTQDNIMDVVVDFLYEISFFGYEQEHLAEEKERLDESIKELEEHPEGLERVDSDELRKELGLPIEEEETYPEEDEKKEAYYEAGREYTQYCKIMELEKIKKAVIEELKNKGST